MSTNDARALAPSAHGGWDGFAGGTICFGDEESLVGTRSEGAPCAAGGALCVLSGALCVLGSATFGRGGGGGAILLGNAESLTTLRSTGGATWGAGDALWGAGGALCVIAGATFTGGKEAAISLDTVESLARACSAGADSVAGGVRTSRAVPFADGGVASEGETAGDCTPPGDPVGAIPIPAPPSGAMPIPVFPSGAMPPVAVPPSGAIPKDCSDRGLELSDGWPKAAMLKLDKPKFGRDWGVSLEVVSSALDF